MGAADPASPVAPASNGLLERQTEEDSDLTSLSDEDECVSGLHTSVPAGVDESELSSLEDSPVDSSSSGPFLLSKVGSSIARARTRPGITTYGRKGGSRRAKRADSNSKDTTNTAAASASPGAILPLLPLPSNSKMMPTPNSKGKIGAKSTPMTPHPLGSGSAVAISPRSSVTTLLNLLSPNTKKRQASQQIPKPTSRGNNPSTSKRSRVNVADSDSDLDVSATLMPKGREKGKSKARGETFANEDGPATGPSSSTKRTSPTRRNDRPKRALNTPRPNSASVLAGTPSRSVVKRKGAVKDSGVPARPLDLSPNDSENEFPLTAEGIISCRIHQSEDDMSPPSSPMFAREDITSISDEWEPPGPDESLKIPGECILAQTNVRRYAGNFYPARIMKYVPPKDQRTPPKYSIIFMDYTKEDATRDRFYTFLDAEFLTCKLGDFERPETLHGNDEHDDLDDSFTTHLEGLETLPEPIKPPPDDFYQLPMFEQMSYILPVVDAIIADSYPPTKSPNEAYMKGGRSREAYRKKVAPQKGALTRRDSNMIVEILKWYALRLKPGKDMQEELRDAPMQVDVDTFPPLPLSQPEDHLRSDDLGDALGQFFPPPSPYPSSLPPSSLPSSSLPPSLATPPDAEPDDGVSVDRPPSKMTFFDLSESDKLGYCADVLLQEALIQILLWRTGKRTEIALGRDEAETELREIGEAMVQDKGIAASVLALRDLAGAKHRREKEALEAEKVLIGGTLSRPVFRTLAST